MFSKKIIILLFLTVHLTLSLKPTEFCIIKQKECKGYHDKNQIYNTNCSLIKCHGKLKYECVSNNLCSKNKIGCQHFVEFDAYLKLINKLKYKSAKYSEAIKEIKNFNKRKNLSFTMRINKFGHLSRAELNSIYLTKINISDLIRISINSI